MTAHAIFPPGRPKPPMPSGDPTPPRTPGLPAEVDLIVTLLRLAQAGTDPAARICAAFGPRQGAPVLTAIDRLVHVLDYSEPRPGDVPRDRTGTTDPVMLAGLVRMALDGPDAEEHARLMALEFVPAHRMQDLVAAARGLGLALRRAVLQCAPRAAPGCPASGMAPVG